MFKSFNFARAMAVESFILYPIIALLVACSDLLWVLNEGIKKKSNVQDFIYYITMRLNF